MNRRAIMFGGGAALLAAGGAAAVSFARMGTLADYDEATAAQRAALVAEPELKDLVRLATVAANGHNTQPWRFRIGASEIRIEPDFSRRTPVVDPDDHHVFASLGCAAANLELAARASGRVGEIGFDAAAQAVTFAFRRGDAAMSELYAAIPHRQSTRAEFDGRAAPADVVAKLQAAAAVPGVETTIVTDAGRRGQIRDLVVAGNSAQMADKAFVAELRQWMRFNPRAALAAGDGLFSAASGNPTLPTWLGGPLFDMVFTAAAENPKYLRQLDTSAGVAVFVGDKADPAHWVKAGVACQRFALQATALGLKHSFINQPVEVASLRPELAKLVGAGGRRPDIVMRFGYGPELPKSPRRPVEAVLA